MSMYVGIRGHQLCFSCLLMGLENKVVYFFPSSLITLLGNRYTELPVLSLGSQCRAHLPRKVSFMSETHLVLSFSLKAYGLER